MPESDPAKIVHSLRLNNRINNARKKWLTSLPLEIHRWKWTEWYCRRVVDYCVNQKLTEWEINGSHTIAKHTLTPLGEEVVKLLKEQKAMTPDEPREMQLQILYTGIVTCIAKAQRESGRGIDECWQDAERLAKPLNELLAGQVKEARLEGRLEADEMRRDYTNAAPGAKFRVLSLLLGVIPTFLGVMCFYTWYVQGYKINFLGYVFMLCMFPAAFMTHFWWRLGNEVDRTELNRLKEKWRKRLAD